MNKQEILKSAETILPAGEEVRSENSSLTKTEVEEIYNFRQSCLQQVRSLISLKFYHFISEKLENEKRALEKLLDFQDNTQEVLSHYSFVLNPYYFEQRFFGSEV